MWNGRGYGVAQLIDWVLTCCVIQYKDAVSGTTAVDKSRPPDFEELEEPVLHTISDLAALLLEYNKLTGRLLQFTPYNIITNSTT